EIYIGSCASTAWSMIDVPLFLVQVSIHPKAKEAGEGDAERLKEQATQRLPCQCRRLRSHSSWQGGHPRLKLGAEWAGLLQQHLSDQVRTIRSAAPFQNWAPSGSVPGSVQLVLTRQDEKERKQSDDGQRWSDDSYSPRRHWCSILKPDRKA